MLHGCYKCRSNVEELHVRYHSTFEALQSSLIFRPHFIRRVIRQGHPQKMHMNIYLVTLIELLALQKDLNCFILPYYARLKQISPCSPCTHAELSPFKSTDMFINIDETWRHTFCKRDVFVWGRSSNVLSGKCTFHVKGHCKFC